jgi:hypothetical protein
MASPSPNDFDEIVNGARLGDSVMAVSSRAVSPLAVEGGGSWTGASTATTLGLASALEVERLAGPHAAIDRQITIVAIRP